MNADKAFVIGVNLRSSAANLFLRIFQQAPKPNVVTIPGRPGDDLPLGTLKPVLKSAGLEDRK